MSADTCIAVAYTNCLIVGASFGFIPSPTFTILLVNPSFLDILPTETVIASSAFDIYPIATEVPFVASAKPPIATAVLSELELFPIATPSCPTTSAEDPIATPSLPIVFELYPIAIALSLIISLFSFLSFGVVALFVLASLPIAMEYCSLALEFLPIAIASFPLALPPPTS